MNRSIILSAILISAAILLNGYLDRVARAPHLTTSRGKEVPIVENNSIAVLPLDDLNASGESSAFADGIRREVISRLTKLGKIRVVSSSNAVQGRASATPDLRAIGKNLGVTHLLLIGSVQRVANRIRVDVQLIDVATNTHVWAEHYDREVNDVFAVESDIAAAITDQLAATHKA